MAYVNKYGRIFILAKSSGCICSEHAKTSQKYKRQSDYKVVCDHQKS